MAGLALRRKPHLATIVILNEVKNPFQTGKKGGSTLEDESSRLVLIGQRKSAEAMGIPLSATLQSE